MPFHNRVRLPLTIDRAQYSATREVYTKADGTTKTLSAILKKTYQGKTDWLPEKWHERLIVALNHDTVNIEGEKYLGGVALDGDSAYQIDWDDTFRTPIAGAKFQVLVTPFDNSNDNCMTCDQANQVVLVDDAMPSNLSENTTYTIDVIQNDSICCYPVVFTITKFNSDYLSSCTIDATGTVTLHTKSGLVAINGIDLFTYRATCTDSGGYDEADCFGNINGTVPGCLAPTGVHSTGAGTTTANFAWTAPSPAPDHYYWQLLSATNVVVQSGDTGSLFENVTGLAPNTSYKFQVRSACAPGDADINASNWIQLSFTTAPLSPGLCGSYRLFPTSGGDALGNGIITYLGCDGLYHNIVAHVLTPVTVCALQSAPGSYTDISSTFGGLNVVYLSLCGAPSPTLTFSFTNAGGSFQSFAAALSIPIDAVVNIGQIFADGFTAGDCSGGAVASAQRTAVGTFSIGVGNTANSAGPTSTSGTWSSANSHTIYNVLVNGTPVINGSTITIGSYTVQIIIPSCA